MYLRILFLILCSLGCVLSANAQKSKTFVKSFSMPGWEEPVGFLELEDGWLIAGMTNDNLQSKYIIPKFGFLMKVDLEGNVMWRKIYGDSINWMGFSASNLSVKPNCLLLRKNGRVVVIGSTAPNGYSNIFAMEINPDNGGIKWTYRDSFPDNIGPSSLCEDDKGNIYILAMRYFGNQTGYPCVFKVGKDGKSLWKKHYIEYDQSAEICDIIVNGKHPVMCLSLASEIRDSSVMLTLNDQTGVIVKRTVLISKNPSGVGRSIIIQIFKIESGYNIFLKNANERLKSLQMFVDSNLNILQKKYIKPNDSLINDFYGEGYTYNDTLSRVIRKYVDKFGNLKANAKVPGLLSDDTMIIYSGQSKFGGLYFLGYIWVGGFDPNDCLYRVDCKNILLIRTDSLGRFNLGKDTPKIEKGGVLIFPNPVKDKLKIGINLEEASKVNIDLYDHLGQNVLQMVTIEYPKGYQQLELDISSLQTGVYVCKVNTTGGISFIKILVQ
jgi:hypothetical protein